MTSTATCGRIATRWLPSLLAVLVVGCAAPVGPDPIEPIVPAGQDEASLVILAEECERGDLAACDELWWSSPPGSEQERLGLTCGGRIDPDDAEPGSCTSAVEELPPAETPEPEPALETLTAACAEEGGAACDELWWTSPPDSEQERFGLTCGDRVALSAAEPGTCADRATDTP